MLENGALDGITVVDLSRLLPGPYGSMILADHGARVIAVEDKRFLADGLFFTPCNRNKEHMSLNLKTDDGKEIFFRLAEKADVIMEGFRPGVVDRLGVGYEAVRKVKPDIIYCAITGYGQTGAYRERAGHDVNYLSYAGVLDQVGEPDRPPSIPGVQIADMVGGGINAVVGILLALLAREKTGKGQYIDISMTDGMVALLPAARYFQALTGKPPGRGNWMLSHRYACYNTYETSDGQYISIGAVEHRFWKRLCEHLGLMDCIPLQYDDARRRDIIARLRDIFKTRTRDQWAAELEALDVCFGRVQNVDEVFRDPFFRERDMIVDLERSSEAVLGVPVKLSETPGAVRTTPVAFGASTPDILKELGYTEDQVAVFSERDVI